MPFFCSMRVAIPLRKIIIPPNGVHLVVAAFINGQLANLLLDTGASQTVMDHNRMALFTTDTVFESSGQLSKGLGTDGMEGHRFTILQFILGDLVLDDFEVTLLDLSHVNSSYFELDIPSIDMVLGGDVLQDYAAVLDYGSQQLILSLPD